MFSGGGLPPRVSDNLLKRKVGKRMIDQEVKVFRINDQGVAEWVVGESIEQVVTWYEQATGEKIQDIREESLNLKFNMEKEDGTDYELRTLRELLRGNLEETPYYIGYSE